MIKGWNNNGDELLFLLYSLSLFSCYIRDKIVYTSAEIIALDPLNVFRDSLYSLCPLKEGFSNIYFGRVLLRTNSNKSYIFDPSIYIFACNTSTLPLYCTISAHLVAWPSLCYTLTPWHRQHSTLRNIPLCYSSYLYIYTIYYTSYRKVRVSPFQCAIVDLNCNECPRCVIRGRSHFPSLTFFFFFFFFLQYL